MYKVIEALSNITFNTGKKIVVASIIAILLFSLVDSNFLYYYRAEKRIEILKMMTEFDKENIEILDKKEKHIIGVEEFNRHQTIAREYSKLIDEMDYYQNSTILSSYDLFNERVYKIIKIRKFISGAIVFMMISSIKLFMNEEVNALKYFLISFPMGVLGYILPTFRVHELNYIGLPLMIILYLFLDYLEKKDKISLSNAD